MRKIMKILLVLIGLSLTLMPFVQAAGRAQAGEAQENVSVVKKYPPYPDVWDWVIPFPDRKTQYLQADILPSGDVRISYEFKSKKSKKGQPNSPKGETYGITFFERQLINSHEGIIGRNWRVSLINGKILESGSNVMRESKGCFERADRSFFLKDTQGELLAETNLFYVLNKPKQFTVREDCYDGADFTYQVEAMRASLVPLKDGTFLVIDRDHGLVIRFDEQFKTKSALLNHRVFVVDSNSVPFRAPSAEEGNRDWQRYEDDLFRYLMEVKGRE